MVVNIYKGGEGADRKGVGRRKKKKGIKFQPSPR